MLALYLVFYEGQKETAIKIKNADSAPNLRRRDPTNERNIYYAPRGGKYP